MINFSYSVVSLLDYRAGNVRSIRNAIHHLGYQITEVTYVFYLHFSKF